MKKIFVYAIVLSLLVIAAASAYVNHVYSSEDKSSIGMAVIVFNHEDTVSTESNVAAYIPDLDARDNSENFKLKANSERKVYLQMGVEDDYEPDYYPVIITFTNEDGVRKKTHTWVYIN